MTAVILKILHPFKYPELTVMPSELMKNSFCPPSFTCQDGKGGKLSSRASKTLYKPLGAVYIGTARPIRLLETLCSALKLY